MKRKHGSRDDDLAGSDFWQDEPPPSVSFEELLAHQHKNTSRDDLSEGPRSRPRREGCLKQILIILATSIITGIVGLIPNMLDTVRKANERPGYSVAVVPPVGQKVLINGTNGEPLTLYSGASKDATPLLDLPGGVKVIVTQGPREADGVTWWRVRGDFGQGWVIGGSRGGSEALMAFSPELGQQAIDYLTQFLDQQPDADLYQQRGLAYYSLGDDTEAIADFSRALDLDPEDVMLYALRAQAYYNKKRYQAALDDYTAAIQYEPETAWLYDARCYNAYLPLEDYGRAMLDCDRAIELNPKMATFFNDRGSVFSEMGNFSGAYQEYNQAIALDPDYAFAYRNQGYIEEAWGNTDKAIDLYNRALALDPAFYQIYVDIGVVYGNHGDKQKAITFYTRAIEAEPTNAYAYANRGLEYHDLGDLTQAITDLSAAIRIDPTLAFAHYNLGQVYYQMEDYERAIVHYTDAITQDPGFVSAYVNRGSSYRLIGNYSAAMGDLKAAMRLDENSENAYGELGNTFYDQGWYSEALEYYQIYLQKSANPKGYIVKRVDELQSQSAP